MESLFLNRNMLRFIALLTCVVLLSLTATNIDTVILYGRLSKWRHSSANTIGNMQTQACFIPKLTPGDEKLRQLDSTSARRTAPPNCYKLPLLFTVDVESRLRKNEDHPLAQLATDCFFKPLERDCDKPEFQFLNTSTLYKITKLTVKLPSTMQTLHVWCKDVSGNITIYEDYLSAVQPKPELEAKLKEREPRDKKDFWSVLMISQDSCSHMNFRRYQPRVHDYLLKELEAIEFHGFNSLGAGTHQNIFPLLTGLPLSLYRERCNPNFTHFESCPYIWKEFAARGYRTAFSDQSIHEMGVFNFKYMKGFTKPTFGYDFREVVHLLEARGLKGHENEAYDMFGRFCHGSRMKVETLLDHALKMATTFAKEPYWFLTWTASLPHYSNPLARYAEEPLLSTLKQLHENQLLNKTILVLLSDHGAAWGNFRRSSRQGFLEDRLPMLYIALPKAFRRRYPRAFKNMRGNVKRLTTMYDLHATMEHLLHPETLEDAAVQVGSQEPGLEDNKSVSLFLPISPSRTCETIPFLDMYCICLDRIVMSPKDRSAKSAAATALAEINKRLSNHSQCHQLLLVNITQAFKTKPNQVSHGVELGRFNTSKERADQVGEVIEVEIETQPGNGAFYCSVSQSYDNVQNRYTTKIDVVRVNLYGSAGDCVSIKELQPLCYCR